jgi:hypothetical protein
MDEGKQSEDVIKRWAELQQKLLTSWLDTVRNLGGEQSAKVWSETLEAWQQSINQTMDTQANWARNWAETFAAAEGAPEGVREQVRRGQEVLQLWTDAQKELWQNWFKSMKTVLPAMESGSAAGAGQNMAQIWQDMGQKMIDAQAEWVRRWTGGTAG